MIVSGFTVKKSIKDGSIVIEGADEQQFQPASVDLRLAESFLVMDEHNLSELSLNSEVCYRKIKGKEVIIPPKSFVLAKTMEHIEVPLDMTAFVEGRSSVGRLGLFIQNAGFVDPGFKGTITLELFNATNLPMRLQAGRRICQLVFMQLDRKLEKGYSGKYQGQSDVTGSKICRDVECE